MLIGWCAAIGFGQTVQPRDIAAFSPDDSGRGEDESQRAVYETTLIVGDGVVMAVYHSLPENTLQEIGYALAELQGGSWSWTQEGIINRDQFAMGPNDPNHNVDLTDPSVAYNSLTGDFVVCAMTSSGDRILVAHYDSNAQPPAFEPWEKVARASRFDKPWIVAGDDGLLPTAGFGPLFDTQEFYITWNRGSRLNYAHSINGGQTWVSTDPGNQNWDALTDLDDLNSRITPARDTAPRVFDSRPLYVAFEGGGKLEFVRGNDIKSGSHAGEVKFIRLALVDSGGQPTTFDLNMARSLLGFYTPLGFLEPRGPGFDMAVDPTDGGKLYVVYHDTATSEPSDQDVNIYLRTLDRQSGATWELGDRKTIVDDTVTTFESDQFMPAIDVDSLGNIHVIYYDDQNYTDPDDPNDPPGDQQPDLSFPAKFDAWYAFSANQGVSWTNDELCDDPPSCANTDPAVDFALPATGFPLLDYVGIDAGSDRIWTSFMGTALQDPNPDKSIIWSSQIVLP